jgi:hypothetical protein
VCETPPGCAIGITLISFAVSQFARECTAATDAYQIARVCRARRGGGTEKTLAFYAFPEEYWRRIRTNNPLERILPEIRRRSF